MNNIEIVFARLNPTLVGFGRVHVVDGVRIQITGRSLKWGWPKIV